MHKASTYIDLHVPSLIIFSLLQNYIWDCRRNQILPNITGFKFKVRLKYEVELYIGSYGKKKDILRNKWAGFQDLLLQE